MYQNIVKSIQKCILPVFKKEIKHETVVIPHKKVSMLTDDKLVNKTIEIRSGCIKVHAIFKSNKQGELKRVEFHAGKNGSCHHIRFEEYAELTNMILGLGGDISEVAKTLSDRLCCTPTICDGIKVKCCGEAVAKAIEIYQKGDKK